MDRRLHPRFITPPMYHAVALRNATSEHFNIDGHAWDLSLGGAQIEVDAPIAPGTPVGLRIDLPAGFDAGPGRAVFARATVVWCFDPAVEEEGDAGPVRLGLSIVCFSRVGDAARLSRYLNYTRLRVAA